MSETCTVCFAANTLFCLISFEQCPEECSNLTCCYRNVVRWVPSVGLNGHYAYIYLHTILRFNYYDHDMFSYVPLDVIGVYFMLRAGVLIYQIIIVPQPIFHSNAMQSVWYICIQYLSNYYHQLGVAAGPGHLPCSLMFFTGVLICVPTFCWARFWKKTITGARSRQKATERGWNILVIWQPFLK